MNHLKIINASRGLVHEYEKKKSYTSCVLTVNCLTIIIHFKHSGDEPPQDCTNISLRLQIKKFPNINFFPPSYAFIAISKYSSKHSVYKHAHSV